MCSFSSIVNRFHSNMSPKSGFYEPFRHALNRFVGLSPMDQVPITSIVAGAASGAVGGKLEVTDLYHIC